MPFLCDETFQSLQCLYRIPAQTIGKIIPETCAAIVKAALETYIQVGTRLQDTISQRKGYLIPTVMFL